MRRCEPISKQLRRHSSDVASEFVFRTPAGGHRVETDWRNYRSRHFKPALERVEAEWGSWRRQLPDPGEVRESVAGLASTRPYDLGRHTHSALMLASGMSLQRLESRATASAFSTRPGLGRHWAATRRIRTSRAADGVTLPLT